MLWVAGGNQQTTWIHLAMGWVLSRVPCHSQKASHILAATSQASLRSETALGAKDILGGMTKLFFGRKLAPRRTRMRIVEGRREGGAGKSRAREHERASERERRPTYTDTHADVHTLMYTHKHARTYTHQHKHKLLLHTHTHKTLTHTHARARARAHTHTHTHTHTHMHTHTHTASKIARGG